MSTTVIREKYAVEHSLGTGSMGTAYKALDTTTQKPVIVKVLDSSVLVENPETIQRFDHDVESLRQLGHPNIVKMLDHFVENEQRYVVLDYVPGSSLKEYLQENPLLDISTILQVGLHLVDAVWWAHRMKVLHRNLKPSNVLLTEDYYPLLTDFGLSLLIKPAIRIGIPHYQSPEACRLEPLDERSDIWSLGVMLYEIVTGVRPFGGENDDQTIDQILNAPPPDIYQYRAETPKSLADLITFMMVKNPAERMNTMRMVSVALELMMREQASGSNAAVTSSSDKGDSTDILPRPAEFRLPAKKKEVLDTIAVAVEQPVEYEVIAPPDPPAPSLPDPGKVKTRMVWGDELNQSTGYLGTQQGKIPSWLVTAGLVILLLVLIGMAIMLRGG